MTREQHQHGPRLLQGGEVAPTADPLAEPTVSNRALSRLVGRRGAFPVSTDRGAERSAESQSARDGPRNTEESGAVVHTGELADEATSSMGALALTFGRHVVLSNLASGAAGGLHNRVLAHELQHVSTQSRTGRQAIQFFGEPGTLSAPPPQAGGEPETDVDGAEHSGLDPADLELLEVTINELFVEADLDEVLDQLGPDSDEGDAPMWIELSENPLARARKFRAAIILERASINSAEQLYEHLDSVEGWAADEGETLTRAGAEWLEEEPWAFPDSWADRVTLSLLPPSGLEVNTALDAAAETYVDLEAVAGRLPGEVWAHGLPVAFSEALALSDFAFRPSLASEPGDHVVYEFARAAARYVPTEVTLRMATGWAAGKRHLVAHVREGRKSIDPLSWAEVASPRVYQPDLSQLVGEALDHEIDIVDTLGGDVIDAWRYELALAKLAGYSRFLFQLGAAAGITARFASSLAEGDALVAAASAEDRLDRADVWADEHGYPAEARAALIASLKANAGQIAKDAATDVIISMIPYVGWAWRAKEFIGEAVDWYEAGEALVSARDRASSAVSVIRLQQASATICSAETGIAAQIALEAVGKGAEIAVSTAVKAVKGSLPLVTEPESVRAGGADLGTSTPDDTGTVDATAPDPGTTLDPRLEAVREAGTDVGASVPPPESLAGVQQAISVLEKALTGAGEAAPPRPAALPAPDADTEISLLHGTDQPGLEGLGAVGDGKIDVGRSSGVAQDLGRGFYMALDTATAEAYASTRVSQRKTGPSHVLEFRLPVSALGKVVDIRRGGAERELWEAFLDRPPFDLPAGVRVQDDLISNRAYLTGAGVEKRGIVFEAFLSEIKQSDADTIIAPLGDDVFTGITAGKETAQVCIRSQKVADRLNAQIRGAE